MPDATSQQFLRDLDKKLWTAADRLRANLDAAAHGHVLAPGRYVGAEEVADDGELKQAEALADSWS